MKLKSTLIVLLLTCLIAGQTYSAYAADYRPHLQVTAANTTFAAGSRGTLTLTLLNDGNFDATEVEAVLSSATPGVTPLAGAQKVINLVGRGSSVSYDVVMLIDQNVVTGAYTLNLSLNYLRGGYGVVTVTVPVPIVVDRPSLPSLKITASSNRITLGDANKLHLTAENIASANVTDVDVTLAASSSLLAVTDSMNYHFAALEAGESEEFDAAVQALENTPIGVYSLTAQVWYVNTYGVTLKQTISIPLEVTAVAVSGSPVVTIRNVSPKTVSPGEVFTIDLEVECTGVSTYNARAVLSQDATGSALPLSPTTVSIGDLSIGATSRVSYTMILSGSASAGDIPLAVAVRYVDSKGVSGTATETITIPVEDLVEFSLMEDVEVSAERGATTTFEGDLLLVGTGKVEFASIGVVPSGPVQRVTGSTEYVGAIDPDSPVPFTIRFKTGNDTAPGDYDLTLRVTYLNSRNVEENRTISIPLHVAVPSPSVAQASGDDGIWSWLRRLFGLQ